MSPSTPDDLPDFSCHSDTSTGVAAHKWHTAQGNLLSWWGFRAMKADRGSAYLTTQSPGNGSGSPENDRLTLKCEIVESVC